MFCMSKQEFHYVCFFVVFFYIISHIGGRVLQIPRAQAKDSGRYTCVAVNEAGEDSIQYDVRVLCESNLSVYFFLILNIIRATTESLFFFLSDHLDFDSAALDSWSWWWPAWWGHSAG